MKAIGKIFFILMIILIFSSCFSEWKGDGATLTISFGGSGNGRAVWPSDESVIWGQLDYEVTLSSGGTEMGPFAPPEDKNYVEVPVSPGLWNVTIKAYYDDLLFAEGTSKDVEVIAGQDKTVVVPMRESEDYTFFAVGSDTEWENVMGQIKSEPTGKTYVITVTKDFSANSYLTLSGSDIIIRGNYTVTLGLDGKGSLLNILNQNVTLRDVKLKGNNSNNSQLVTVESGSFTMEGSASVTGNTNNGGNGGGVVVYGGSFTMEGSASVTDNTNNGGDGGGVVVYGGTFNMSGSAVISGNILTEKNLGDGGADGGNGGGVYVDGGTFNMSGSAVISENTVAVNIQDTGYGGGVYIKNGTFTMSGSAVISGNTAAGTDSGGGGVYVSNGGAFTMNGGTIGGDKANTATIGGGVFVSGSNSKFTMSGSAVISGNTATSTISNKNSEGGGVYIGISSEFIMEDGTISGNKAIAYGEVIGQGGGVYVANYPSNSSTFIMKDGTISGNKASRNGGGVFISGGTFTMEGGTIGGDTENDANTAVYGGGVVIGSAKFYMSGNAVIKKNTVSGDGSSGGGVYIFGSTAEFNMSGGEIRENTAASGGGVYVSTSGKFIMEGGSISGNKASGTSGGGVYVSNYSENSSTFTMSGGYVSGNTGGGVMVANAEFTMSGGYVSGNIGSGVRISGGDPIIGKFTMSGGEVSGNTSDSYGGGVNVSAGTFTMTGGTISGNAAIANTAGGGVYLSTTANFYIVTGTVYGSGEGNLSNTATEGAALLKASGGAGVTQRGTYTGNTWDSAGNLTTSETTITVVSGALVP